MTCWIGDFEVRPRRADDERLDGSAGAFVAVVGRAKNPEAFVGAVKRELTGTGLTVEAIEPLLDRRSRTTVADDLLRAADGLDSNRPIFVGHVQAWGH